MTRGVPDVAADADQPGPPTVFAGGSIETNLGTSNSAPLWGGLIALADQDAHHDLGFVNPALYRIARSSSYHKAFHDITTGNNDAADRLRPGHRFPGRSRLGPGDGLGKPQRAGTHPSAGPQQDIAGSCGRPACQRQAGGR